MSKTGRGSLLQGDEREKRYWSVTVLCNLRSVKIKQFGDDSGESEMFI